MGVFFSPSTRPVSFGPVVAAGSSVTHQHAGTGGSFSGAETSSSNLSVCVVHSVWRQHDSTILSSDGGRKTSPDLSQKAESILVWALQQGLTLSVTFCSGEAECVCGPAQQAGPGPSDRVDDQSCRSPPCLDFMGDTGYRFVRNEARQTSPSLCPSYTTRRQWQRARLLFLGPG